MGHVGAPSWPCVGIEQVVRAHDGEALVDGATLALLDLVDRRLHVVVDAASGDAAHRRERARVRIEQHLVALARVGHEPEGSAGTQLEVRDLHAVVDAADHQALFAPVELEGFAEFEGQRHKGLGGDRLAFALAPRAHEVGDAAVATGVAIAPNPLVQCTCRAPLVPRAVRVSLQCQLERLVVRRELARRFAAPVLRLL